MNFKRCTRLLPVLCWLPALAWATPLPLDSVLQRATSNPASEAANARLQARYAASEQRESEAGWQMFGNADVGRYRELVTEDLRNDYYGRSFAVGVRYPLLGSLRRRLDAVDDSRRDIHLAEIEQGYQRARQRLAVRSAYADWWRASEEQRLCRGLKQASEAAEAQLRQRLDERWILPSDAQLMRGEWQALSDRCALQDDLLGDIRASLESLGVTLRPGDTPVPSQLARHPQPLDAWRPLLQDNPRLAGRDAELANAERQRKKPWYTAIDAYFSVTQTVEERSGAADRGSGLAAGLTLSAPVDLLDYGTARSREGEARYQAAVQAREQEQGELLRELGKVIAQQRRSVNEYQRLRERRTGLRQVLDERRQRGELDAGEASLRLQQARIDDYNAGFAQIAAWHRVWLQDAALRVFGDDSQRFEQLLGSRYLRWDAPGQIASAPLARGWRQGVYIWHSQALLDPARRSDELAELHRAGIDELHLGLDAAQVNAGEATHAQLLTLLQAAHTQGLKVNLLLGDPHWIEPAGRGQLLGLIQRFAGLPFDGLHLDLEVEQLGWPVPDQRVQDWLQTLREAKAHSPWPLALSSHPRWFEVTADASPCVPCELQRLGVTNVSLMIYQRQANKSTRRALDIARRWPALHLRLAQSIEADQPDTLSWAGSSPAQLQQLAAGWQRSLQPAGLAGIDWQSWTDYPRSR